MDAVDWILWTGYFIAFIAIIAGWIWTTVLFIAGYRYQRRWAATDPGDESDYLWVFMVPALNEGVTIADSVNRLLEVRATNKVMFVINDGSDDDTGEVLAGIQAPGLHVLTRVAPNARKGKAAALNHAFSYLQTDVLTLPEYERFDLTKVILGIVDADGRLGADSPEFVSRHFDDARIGGIQIRVSIYNQDTWLTRMQHAEFLVFGSLFQLGRSLWGTAFMGGNGQFNRLTALTSIATPEGPWSDFLTEDQELGLRLLEYGWRSEFESRCCVNQQGVSSIRLLYKQRTRWMQGNLQVISEMRRLYARHLVGGRRFDALFTLSMPILQLVVGIALFAALILFFGFGVPLLPLGSPALLAFMVVLAIGPLGMGVLSIGRGGGFKGFLGAVRLLPSYFAYTYIMWPVSFVGMYRQLQGNKKWDKTAREKIKPAGGSSTA